MQTPDEALVCLGSMRKQVSALERVKCLNVRISESFAIVLGTSLPLPQALGWTLREDQAPMFGSKPFPADKAFSA